MSRGTTRVQCKNCGEFFTGHSRAKYCSSICKEEGLEWENHFKEELRRRNGEKKSVHKECLHCGTSFIAKGNAKYCCKECSKEGHKAYMRDYAKKMNEEAKAKDEESRKALEELERIEEEKSKALRAKPKESIGSYNERARALGINYGKLSEMEQAKMVRVIIPRKEKRIDRSARKSKEISLECC